MEYGSLFSKLLIFFNASILFKKLIGMLSRF